MTLKRQRQEVKQQVSNRSSEYMAFLVESNKWIPEMNALVDKIHDCVNFNERYDLAMKLAIYQVTLGELVSLLVRKSNAAYIYRKYSFSSEWVASDLSGNKRDNEAEIAVVEDRINEVALRYVADVMKSKHDDIKSLVMLIQTGAKIRDAEKNTSGM